jgi:hypothetical protein
MNRAAAIIGSLAHRAAEASGWNLAAGPGYRTLMLPALLVCPPMVTVSG